MSNEPFTGVGTLTERQYLNDINKRCEAVKVRKKDEASGKHFFEAGVHSSAGFNKMYRWEDGPKDWTFHLVARDVNETQKPRDIDSIAKSLTAQEHSPTDEEWNLLISAYTNGMLTQEWQEELNFSMNDHYYFRKYVEPAIQNILGFQQQQEQMRKNRELESQRQREAERVKPPKNCIALCNAHFLGWQRDNPDFESTYFKNIKRGSLLCGPCGSPTAVLVIKVK